MAHKKEGHCPSLKREENMRRKKEGGLWSEDEIHWVAHTESIDSPSRS